MLNDILYFPLTTIETVDLGQVEENEVYSRWVYCQKKSISQMEFFNAGQSGIKAEIVLIVFLLDYQNEKSLLYNNVIYDIYRTYERADERIELYCTVKTHGK